MPDDDYALTADAAATADAPELSCSPPKPEAYRPRIGLIGCGGITQQHLAAYRKQGYEVVAFCDLHEPSAAARRDEHSPDADLYTDYHEVLAREDVDVVDVALHPEPRAAVVMDAIRAGKHVLSQKPFVVDLDEGRRLADAADEHSVRLAVNQNGRWAPHVSYMRHAIAQGLIGEVSSVDCTVAWDHNWVVGKAFNDIPHLVLYDFAIHWFDMVRCYMRGRTATRVYASVQHAAGQDARPPLLAQVVIDFEGAQACLAFRANTRFGPRDTTLITGNRGTLQSVGPDLGHQRVTLTTDAGNASPDLRGEWFPDGFAGTMGELLCAIEQDREPGNSGRDNLASLELCFAAMESARIGRPVEPGSVRKLDPAWLSYPATAPTGG